MSFLNTLTGLTGYGAIIGALVVALIVHFAAPKVWSTLVWVVAFSMLSAAFIGQREITASVRADAATEATKRAEELLAVEKAVNKAAETMRVWREKQAALITEVDTKIQLERKDAVEDYKRKSAGLRNGTVRVRYVGAKCPSPASDVPGTATTSGVGDDRGIELSQDAGQDVLDLRAAITQDQQVIRYLREYIRTTVDPHNLE